MIGRREVRWKVKATLAASGRLRDGPLGGGNSMKLVPEWGEQTANAKPCKWRPDVHPVWTIKENLLLVSD
jgi:hypothetical protein